MGDRGFFHLKSKRFKDFLYFLYSTFGLTHSVVNEGSLPVLQMLDAPETLEATVYHDGHACAQCFTLLHTIERKEGKILLHKLKAAITPDAWVSSFPDKRQWHPKTSLFGIMGVFQGVVVMSVVLARLLKRAVFKARTLITDGFYKGGTQ